MNKNPPMNSPILCPITEKNQTGCAYGVTEISKILFAKATPDAAPKICPSKYVRSFPTDIA